VAIFAASINIGIQIIACGFIPEIICCTITVSGSCGRKIEMLKINENKIDIRKGQPAISKTNMLKAIRVAIGFLI
jgi:hypothetical protein